MEKEFAPYEESLELKELGFNEICFCYYLYHDKKIISKELQTVYSPGIVDIAVKPVSTGNFYAFKAPLYQQAFKWFREKHNHNSFIYHHKTVNNLVYFTYILDNDLFETNFKTYEEAELKCLKQLIKIVKNK